MPQTSKEAVLEKTKQIKGLLHTLLPSGDAYFEAIRALNAFEDIIHGIESASSLEGTHSPHPPESK